MGAVAGITYVVDPDVAAPYIDTVETTPVAAANGHVVCLAVGDGRHDEVEHRRVDESDIVDGKVGALFNSEETRTVPLAVLVVFVPVAYFRVSKILI